MNGKPALWISALLLNGALAHAAPLGTPFTYQGRLDENGQPALNGHYQMTFALFSQPATGTAVGSNGIVTVPVTNGLFTVELDFGAAVFTGDGRWLEIAVRTNGGGGFTALTPRQPITPTPYALYALTPAGPTGPQGAQGLKGDKGDPGEAGAQGPAGTVGVQGPQGVSGPAGPQGSKGDKGDVGLTGPQGSTGAAGPQGAKGDTGSTGPAGPQGLKGDKGDKGDTGNAGATGPQGIAGPQGLKGDKGDPGLTGTTGPSGAAGPAGAIGPQGPQGPQGIPGSADGWSRVGNAATTPGVNFIGTTDDQALEIKVNNARVLRLEPNATSPNVIGGWSGNVIRPGVFGASIGGGGALSYFGVEASNVVSDHFGVIGGGAHNLAGNPNLNFTDAYFATVGGGHRNSARGISSTIAGGADNEAWFDNSTVGGGYLNAARGPQTTVGGGTRNMATVEASTVGGGGENLASGPYATVGGGGYNTANSQYATVSGGTSNHADEEGSTVGGGLGNRAIGGFSMVGGGIGNDASGFGSTVAGGGNNTASGNHSTVCGGGGNTASGESSFAAGRRAKALDAGSFVWGDSTDADFGYPGANKFQVRASGGVLFYANAAATVGVYLAPGGNSWAPTSDRHAKENFREINPREVLAKVVALPVLNYNLKSQTNTIRHLGPMAQDFHAAFQVGEDDKHITTIDADGVALAAIQGLNQKLEEQLKEKNASIAALERRLAALEKLLSVETK